MELENKNILVVGVGVTGLAAARFLKTRGACVTVTDIASKAELGDVVTEIKAMGIRLEFGDHRTKTFTEADLIVLSPGVSDSLPSLQGARDKGIPILGEVELASRFIREPIIAVTGTNGKTTTTTLLGEMLKASGFTVFVGGNIGTPLIRYVEKGEKAQMIVAEVSSFQLDTIETFRPKIGVLLNITEDHLDRYADFKEYANAKGRIFDNQKTTDTAVLNGADADVMRISKNVRSRKWFFNAPSMIQAGATIDANRIVCHVGTRQDLHIERAMVKIWGHHNAENVAAASLATLAAEGNMGGIQTAIKRFRGLPHRMEYVATKHRIRFFNDSKATNIDAVKKALCAFKEPVILIMGGRDKGGNFKALKTHIQRHVKKLVLMGEAASTIEAVLGNVTHTKTVATMHRAILTAREAASPGEVVLLSPGCTSFDQYGNYEERGEDFCNIVHSL
jgi:UDP-N-acetylmuramoylalanine--D-glutamate ligase